MKFKKLIYDKLILPMIQSNEPAVYKARGVAIGLAWALTPLVGIQMALVGMTWGVLKYFKYSFSLPLALAWTWVSNVFTLPPLYYAFYVTGQIMRGRFDDVSGYHSLSGPIKEVFLSQNDFLTQTQEFLKLFLMDWGVSMFLGCVPWVIAGLFFGYRLTYQFEMLRLKKKERV